PSGPAHFNKTPRGCQCMRLTGLWKSRYTSLRFYIRRSRPMKDSRHDRVKKASAFAVFLILATVLIQKNGAAENKGNAEAGKSVFEKNCIGCHGKSGEGLGPMSKLPNFKNPSTMKSRSDKELFDKITNGGKGTGMPAWGPVINEKDRWNLVA